MDHCQRIARTHQLACAFQAYQPAIGDLCDIIWRHFGVSTSTGRKADTSSWSRYQVVGILALEAVQIDRNDVSHVGPSRLARTLTECCRRDTPPSHRGRKDPMSDLTRDTAIRYLTKLIGILEQMETLGLGIPRRVFDARREKAIWTEVRKDLVTSRDYPLVTKNLRLLAA